MQDLAQEKQIDVGQNLSLVDGDGDNDDTNGCVNGNGDCYELGKRWYVVSVAEN